MTVREALAEGSAALAAAGIESPGLDASLLLAEALHISRSSLITAGHQPLADESYAAFTRFIKRRLDGECVAYIVGRKEFYGLEFLVNPSVLVPRPDTEILVETALKQLTSNREQVTGNNEQLAEGKEQTATENQLQRALDLCTGSGAIAIALQHEMPELEVWATDISAEALEVAKANAARLVPAATINFCHGDLYDALHFLPNSHAKAQRNKDAEEERENLFSVIISNPPYVTTAEISGLSAEVRMEPRLALDGGADGLDLIRAIIARAPEFLCPGGTLLLEASPDQMQTIATLLQQAGFTGIQTHKDLSGKERVFGGKTNY